MKYYSLFNVFCYLMLLLFLSSCEQEGSDTLNFTSDTKRYSHKALDVIYPDDWILEDDGQDLAFSSDSVALVAPGADRRVVFETTEMSAIYMYFYKSRPQDYLDSANNFISQNRLENNPEVSSFQREMMTILGYKGVKLNWSQNVLGEDIKAELTILQFRTQPYSVIVQFYFFDDDIIIQNKNIIPFLEGISFEPNGVIL